MTNKISVIIPVYNVEKYLTECLESAINQDYPDYELICVDDGSTDRSSEILDEYAEKYSNVKVIHKKNTGYGNSMNVGIEYSSGEFIAILEPDDYISSNMFSSIMSVFQKNKCVDFVKSNFAYITGEEGSYEIKPTKIINVPGIYDRIIESDDIHTLFGGYIAHWTAIYNKAFLNKYSIRFNETPGASYQDTGFWFQTLMYAKKAYIMDKYFYHYRIDNPNSSMSNKEKLFCVYDEYDFVQNKFIKDEKIKEWILPYYTMCRYAASRDTYRRIADEFKLEFLHRVQVDFNKLEERGLLDISILGIKDRETLFKIMDSSDLFYKEQKKCSDMLHMEIKDYNFVYLYGAGVYADKVYWKFNQEDREKIDAFVVSNLDAGRKFHNKPVVELEEVVKTGKTIDSIFIIAVSKKYQADVIGNLNRYGIENFVVWEDMYK
ncbi:Glycosyl transferase family 2 [Lachnospiraceae bacterium]|nr:Glycosyl transferase family 2 [Lachnospiraceae bacterium]